jgi:hypothetical protein
MRQRIRAIETNRLAERCCRVAEGKTPELGETDDRMRVGQIRLQFQRTPGRLERRLGPIRRQLHFAETCPGERIVWFQRNCALKARAGRLDISLTALRQSLHNHDRDVTRLRYPTRLQADRAALIQAG